MGTHQIFKYFKERGFSEKTTIAFTQDAAYPIPNIMLRFLTEDVPKFKSLASFGVVSHPPGEKEAKKIAHMENTLLPTSDKIFYCFHYWDNLMGQTYVTDEYFRKSFVLNHQDITPFIINGLNGEPLWRIYEVPG